MESYYDKVKAEWEDRFERTYGFWRGFVDRVVWRYLDCGIPEAGFARVLCDACRAEFLVTFSCKTRSLCPSCGAKRAAAFAAFLKDELLEDVPHALWSFTIPKMLRPYFLFRRELLVELARAAYETVHELMVAATAEEHFRTAMVGAIQTFSDSLKWNPHLHGLAPRGGWSSSGEWVPVPYIDPKAAELLFRHKVLRFLKDLGLVSNERIQLLLSWEHTGFSVHNTTTVYPSDEAGLQTLAFYLLRAPVSLQRLRYEPNTGKVLYREKSNRNTPEILDPMEFIARLLVHIPDPSKHLVRYWGIYSCRGRLRSHSNPSPNEQTPVTLSASRSALRKRWAHLIRRVYHVEPLICQKCGGTMRVVAFITQPRVIRRILEHLRNRKPNTRAPPPQPGAAHAPTALS
jgi:hypothetical protein